MLGIRGNGDREGRIAPDRSGFAGTAFENWPDIVSATLETDPGVAADAGSWRRHVRRWLRFPSFDTDTGLRKRKFAGRDVWCNLNFFNQKIFPFY